ncbi:MAG: SAM-dependent methyltransferase, partial [Cyanobacteria bacterium P01_F01_bin.3]
PKVADALKPSGAFALLWNMNLEPAADLWERLKTAFQVHAPNLSRYEGLERQAEILIELGQMMVQSARFEPPCIESICCKHSYHIDDYITLLSTYSYYIKLPEIQRSKLFEDLRTTITQWENHSRIQLFNRCGFQLSYKCGATPELS